MLSAGTLELHEAVAEPAQAWTVERVPTLNRFLARLARLDAGGNGAFQHASWLHSWYGCLCADGEVEPLLLAVRAHGQTADAMLLPLVVRRHGGLRRAEPADLGITDYNAAIVRPGLALSDDDIAGLRTALRRALRGCDLLLLDKLPAPAGEWPDPWLRLVDTVDSPLSGHRVRLPDDYADWLQDIGKHARKEFERCWRVFQRAPQARFVAADSVDQGLALLRRLARLQHQRHAHTPGYRLDQPAHDQFYEHFLRANLEGGRCVVTALLVGDEMVAGLFSVHDGRRLTMLRIATAGEQWKACAPGKLLLERTLHEMHARGCREFDFGLGDYEHKRVFRATAVPLREACVALTARGLAWQAGWQLKRSLRRHPALLELARRLRQRLRPD
jgi:CelD/BcsL family acetyltransferase involved in cellulose biosynthesis